MNKASHIRQLEPDDHAQLDAFLAQHPATTMFMRSNLQAAGIARHPRQRHEAAYVGAFKGDELVAVASQNWKGILLVVGQQHIADAARLVVRAAGLDLLGLSGPLDAVEAVRNGLGLNDRPTSLDTPEYLYTLGLSELELPELLHEEGVTCRAPHPDEFELLCKWRLDYHLWLGGEADDAGARSIPDGLRQKIEDDQCRVLAVDVQPVSYTAFNATLPDQVQIGGVWTPRELRNQGYARSAVAGHLLEAREAGIERAILFTAVENVAAQRAYEALGFERIGNYGLVFFEKPVAA